MTASHLASCPPSYLPPTYIQRNRKKFHEKFHNTRTTCGLFLTASQHLLLSWILRPFENVTKALDPLSTEVPVHLVWGKGDCNRKGNMDSIEASLRFSKLRFAVAAMRMSA